MAPSENVESQFVVDLLRMLRQERFRPQAWSLFLQRSWIMSLQTAATHLALRRSWRSVTLLFGTLTCMLLATTAILEGPAALLHLLPGLLFCVAWQQCDLFWHLGLNHPPQNHTLFQHVGIPNTLTLLRGLAAGLLIARLLAGLHTTTELTAGCYLFGVSTDILDGQVARLTHTQSKLGQLLDGETDLTLTLAIAAILFQNGLLPLWFMFVLLLRFIVPLLATLSSYFILAQPVSFGSTLWGKATGAVQCLYFFSLLTPPQLAGIILPLKLPVLTLFLLLLIGAPIAQLLKHFQFIRKSKLEEQP